MIELPSLHNLSRQVMAARNSEKKWKESFSNFYYGSEHCVDLKTWVKGTKYLSGDILNELIGLMSWHVMIEVFVSSIYSANWYALILDEAIDISNKE